MGLRAQDDSSFGLGVEELVKGMGELEAERLDPKVTGMASTGRRAVFPRCRARFRFQR